MGTRDLDRRITALEGRVAWLDEHGTRGVDGIRAQLIGQAENLGEVKAKVDSMGAKVDSIAGRQWQRVAGFIVAMAPVYALLFLAVFTHAGGP